MSRKKYACEYTRKKKAKMKKRGVTYWLRILYHESDLARNGSENLWPCSPVALPYERIPWPHTLAPSRVLASTTNTKNKKKRKKRISQKKEKVKEKRKTKKMKEGVRT